MTIVNTTVHADRVLILTDSAAMVESGEIRNVPKLFALPHIGGMMTGAGDATMLGAFWIRLTLGPLRFQSLDDISDNFGVAMRRGYEGALASMRAKGTEPSDDIVQFSLTIAGYSQRAGRMLAHEFAADADFEIRTVDEGTLAHPAWPEIEDQLYCPDLQSMERLARLQLALLKEKEPAAVAGGPLTAATLTREYSLIERLSE